MEDREGRREEGEERGRRRRGGRERGRVRSGTVPPYELWAPTHLFQCALECL